MDFSSSFRPPVQVDSLSNATGESLGVTQIPYIPLMEHQKNLPEKEKKNRKKPFSSSGPNPKILAIGQLGRSET